MENRLSWNTEQVIAARYSWKDDNGKATETWPDIAKRVAYHTGRNTYQRKEFQEMLLKRTFIPNTPCLVNAGRENGQLMACFLVDVPDSLDGILDAVKAIGTIQKTGGGTGMDGSKLRPKGALIKSTGGQSSGPVSFFSTIFNSLTEAIKQGGVRRGANMLTLNIHHPDILEFICAKQDQVTLLNFNISVTVTDEFMEAVKENKYYPLRWEGKLWNGAIDLGRTAPGQIPIQRDQAGNVSLYAPAVWNLIITSAHKYAEPGVIFIDTVNKYNLIKAKYGDIAGTNPCAEYAAHSWNACNLGSIDVSKFFSKHSTVNAYIDWESLADTVRLAVDFLDNVVTKSVLPLPQIRQMVDDTRPIGLGVMGVADLLIKMKVNYGSDDSIRIVSDILQFIQRHAWLRSMRNARTYGCFPASINNAGVNSAMQSYLRTRLTAEQMRTYCTPRNYQVTTIAPTGTISLIAQCSSGIEPNFSWVLSRSDSIGKRVYPHPLAAEALGIEYDDQDPLDIERAAREVADRQYELPEYFIDAHKLTALDHAKFLAACQLYVDNGISKTCNGSSSDTTEDVKKLYEYCFEHEVRAVSYYRDGSRDNQVLTKIDKPKALMETQDGKVFIYPDSLPTMADDQGATQKPVAANDPGFLAWKARMPVDGQLPMPEGMLFGADPKPKITATVIDLTRGDEPLTGRTYRFRTSPKMYVTVNVNKQGHIIEVFVKGGEVSESLGMMMSLLLREGFPVSKLISRLRTVHGQYAIYFNQRCCTSPEQMIAEVLEIESLRQVGVAKMIVEPFTEANGFHKHGDQQYFTVTHPCPKCMAQLTFTEGCRKCLQCGYEKCG